MLLIHDDGTKSQQDRLRLARIRSAANLTDAVTTIASCFITSASVTLSKRIHDLNQARCKVRSFFVLPTLSFPPYLHPNLPSPILSPVLTPLFAGVPDSHIVATRPRRTSGHGKRHYCPRCMGFVCLYVDIGVRLHPRFVPRTCVSHIPSSASLPAPPSLAMPHPISCPGPPSFPTLLPPLRLVLAKIA